MSELTVVTGRESFLAAAGSAPSGVRAPIEVRVDVSDPFTAYRRARDSPGGVRVETTGGKSGWGWLGVSPVRRVQVGTDAVEGAR